MIREALLSHGVRPYLELIASRLGLPASALEAFATGSAKLVPEVVQALVRIVFGVNVVTGGEPAGAGAL